MRPWGVSSLPHWPSVHSGPGSLHPGWPENRPEALHSHEASPPSQCIVSTGLAGLPLIGAWAAPPFLRVAARLHLSSLSAVGSSSGLGFSGAGTGRVGAGFASQFGSSQSWHGSGEPRAWGMPWLGSFTAAKPPSPLPWCHGGECRASWNV